MDDAAAPDAAYAAVVVPVPASVPVTMPALAEAGRGALARKASAPATLRADKSDWARRKSHFGQSRNGRGVGGPHP